MRHWSELLWLSSAATLAGYPPPPPPYPAAAAARERGPAAADTMLLYESVFMNEQTYSAAFKFYGEMARHRMHLSVTMLFLAMSKIKCYIPLVAS